MLRIRVKNRSTSNFTKDSSRCCNTSRLAARIIYFSFYEATEVLFLCIKLNDIELKALSLAFYVQRNEVFSLPFFLLSPFCIVILIFDIFYIQTKMCHGVLKSSTAIRTKKKRILATAFLSDSFLRKPSSAMSQITKKKIRATAPVVR